MSFIEEDVRSEGEDSGTALSEESEHEGSGVGTQSSSEVDELVTQFRGVDMQEAHSPTLRYSYQLGDDFLVHVPGSVIHEDISGKMWYRIVDNGKWINVLVYFIGDIFSSNELYVGLEASRNLTRFVEKGDHFFISHLVESEPENKARVTVEVRNARAAFTDGSLDCHADVCCLEPDMFVLNQDHCHPDISVLTLQVSRSYSEDGQPSQSRHVVDDGSSNKTVVFPYITTHLYPQRDPRQLPGV